MYYHASVHHKATLKFQFNYSTFYFQDKMIRYLNNFTNKGIATGLSQGKT